MPNNLLYVRSNSPESYNEFLDSYFFNLGKRLFRFFSDQVNIDIVKHLWPIAKNVLR